jgi:hypothetical protein
MRGHIVQGIADPTRRAMTLIAVQAMPPMAWENTSIVATSFIEVH